MPSLQAVALPAHPYVDSRRVFFEVSDESGPIDCAISQLALETVSGVRCFKSSVLLSAFRNARPRIEACALQKWRERPDSVCGRLNLWADDLAGPPAGGVPRAARGLSAPPADW